MNFGNDLLYCLKSNRLESVKEILESIVTVNPYSCIDYVNTTDPTNGFSARQYAVSSSAPSHDVIKVLLKFKAEVTMNSQYGFSVLHSAISNPNADHELIELFLSHGANANAKNFQDGDCTALHCALRNQCRKPNYKVIELLLKHGVDIHARDFKDGPNTALQYAVKNTRLSYEVLELLLKYKPNVNVINPRDGLSVLQYAVKNPNLNPKMIELLLLSGADVHAKNEKDGNCTALIYAITKHIFIYEEIELLLRFKSDVNAENYSDGFSVLEYAVSHPNVNFKVVELLLKYNPDIKNDSTMNYVIRNPNIDPKVVELMCTSTKCKMQFGDLIDNSANFEAVKVLVRRETDHFHILKECLEDGYSWAAGQKVCYEILKCIVLQHFKKDPKGIKDLHTIESVLEEKYIKLISGHKFRYVIFNYINSCILEITSMKMDGVSALLFPEMGVAEPSSSDTRVIANRLLNIYSEEACPIYLDIIESNTKSKDVLNLLEQFQIYTRLAFEGTETKLFLGYLPTLLIVEHLPLNDMLSLVQAFYGSVKNQTTVEKKEGNACKKQRLN